MLCCRPFVHTGNMLVTSTLQRIVPPRGARRAPVIRDQQSVLEPIAVVDEATVSFVIGARTLTRIVVAATLVWLPAKAIMQENEGVPNTTHCEMPATLYHLRSRYLHEMAIMYWHAKPPRGSIRYQKQDEYNSLKVEGIVISYWFQWLGVITHATMKRRMPPATAVVCYYCRNAGCCHASLLSK